MKQIRRLHPLCPLAFNSAFTSGRLIGRLVLASMLAALTFAASADHEVGRHSGSSGPTPLFTSDQGEVQWKRHILAKTGLSVELPVKPLKAKPVQNQDFGELQVLKGNPDYPSVGFYIEYGAITTTTKVNIATSRRQALGEMSTWPFQKPARYVNRKTPGLTSFFMENDETETQPGKTITHFVGIFLPHRQVAMLSIFYDSNNPEAVKNAIRIMDSVRFEKPKGKKFLKGR